MPLLPDERPLSPTSPAFVIPSAAALAALAGFANAALLVLAGVPVSHVSGAVSRLGLDASAALGSALAGGGLAASEVIGGEVAGSVAAGASLAAGIVLGFGAGAMLSGAVIGGSAVRLGRRYGVVLLLEAVVLLAAAALGARVGTGLPCATATALACGLQNGMASNYRGLIVRTTHMTGLVTDLGVLLGRRLRGEAVPSWSLTALVATLAAFGVGGALGAWGTVRAGAAALLAPAALAAGLGTAYLRWRIRADRNEERAAP